MNEKERALYDLSMLPPYIENLKRKAGMDLEQKLQEEQELFRPYNNIFRGLEVPIREIHPVFDAAIDAGIEGKKLGRKINEEGIVVIFQIKPKKHI